MDLRLYNNRTRLLESFEPQDPRRVTMYVCGPTVYNYVHIGNARPPVVFGVLANLLRRHYPKLVYARNITDVDDKINDAARELGVPISVITDKYAAAYHDDMARLGVAPPDVVPYATAHIPHIIAMIERLIDSGHAYAAEGHVLFSVASFPDYGKLSRRDPDEMLAGARVEVAPYKRDPGDFVLWKPSTPDLPGWDSPWGVGRPGWHIECSAMAEAHLGDTIDIHGGGVDLQFPHHENEVAQSTCAHGGQVFARFWLHNGMLNLGGAKMSKSVGNVSLVHDLLRPAPARSPALRPAVGPLPPAAGLVRRPDRAERAHARPPLRHPARPGRRAGVRAAGAVRGRIGPVRRPQHAGRAGRAGAHRRRSAQGHQPDLPAPASRPSCSAAASCWACCSRTRRRGSAAAPWTATTRASSPW